ncbi:MAG: N-acetyl-gamma-glutamyl-phosphate reductase [Lachnospiraceae bacterium]|nr:N-acetyl-gamma-glutamyl-phosphate reductase [Lachnospiraceae bacterium]
MKKVFIDGSAGTTGLRIKERLSGRDDIEMIILSEELRKDDNARKECLNSSDISILCLPDDAAKQAVLMVENPDAVIIDTSTAHRTNDDFTYGFPEIGGNLEKIKTSKRIANPGCHASGFISLVAPLIEKGVISPDEKLSAFSLTGYSGGGKKMIAEYEGEDRSPLLEAPRMYGVTQKHKHLPEMVKVCGLTYAPVFCPIVAPYYAGMEVTVSLFGDSVKGGIEAIKDVYREYYGKGLIHYEEETDSFLSACELEGYDDMQVTVTGNEDRILLVSRFDNLGKGASGSAIQNMNISLGLSESYGLNLKYKEEA